MTCDRMMRSGGYCGRPMGHGGKHLSPKSIQNEAERLRLRRMTPGPCTMKGCDGPRICYDNGRFGGTASYDARCSYHKYTDGQRRAAKQRLKLLGEMGITVPEVTVRGQR